VPAALARSVLDRLGAIEAAYVDGVPVRVEARADGSLAVG
jgi:hypothetical protein